eukprot:Nk52_evm6s268 gene=Nk52_evmTU6s268
MPPFVADRDAPLQWEQIEKLQVDVLERNAKGNKNLQMFERLYDMLIRTNIDKSDDSLSTEDLKHLFKVTQVILEVKGVQVDEADDELDKMEQKLEKLAVEGTSCRLHTSMIKELQEVVQTLDYELGTKDDEIDNLRERVALLNQQIKDKGFDVPVSPTKKNADSSAESRRENISWNQEQAIYDLRERVKNLQQELGVEKESNMHLETDLKALKSQLSDVEKELEHSKEDIEDYKTQLEAHRERIRMRKNAEDEQRNTLRHKSKDIAKYLREIEILTERNESLEQQVERMTTELEGAVNEMEMGTKQHKDIMQTLQTADEKFAQVERERDLLQGQVEDMALQLQERGIANDAIMDNVNDKIEEWKALFAEKDAEVLEYAQIIEQQKLDIVTLEKELATTSLYPMKKALAQLEKENEQLREKLSSATETINLLSAGIEQDPEKGTYSFLKAKEEQDALKSKVEELQNSLDGEKMKRKKAEDIVTKRDEELTAVLSRMTAYEQGTYGLYEAVQEIKEQKSQIAIRDSDIASLTKTVNKLESDLQDLFEENEELRRRLGMDPHTPVDVSELRYRKNVELEQLRSVNRVLEKDVEKLEEERIKLKSQMRLQAMNRGERAVQLGLTTEDLEAVEDYAEQLREGTEKDKAMKTAKIAHIHLTEQFQGMPEDELRARLSTLSVEMNDLRGRLSSMSKAREEVTQKMTDIQHENSLLEKAIKEISEQMKNINGSSSVGEIKCPSLEMVLKMWDDKAQRGPVIASQVPSNDNGPLSESEAREGNSSFSGMEMEYAKMAAVQAELRANLRQAQEMNENYVRELERKAMLAEAFKGKLNEMEMKAGVELTDSIILDSSAIQRHGDTAVTFSSSSPSSPIKQFEAMGRQGESLMTIQPHLSSNANELVGCLNEQLITCLHELNVKETLLCDMEKKIEIYKSKFATVLSQKGILYEEHMKLKRDWDNEKQGMVEHYKELAGKREEDRVRIEELERLQSILAHDPDEMKKSIGELSRKMTVLRVNEKSLSRRYTCAKDLEELLRKNVKKLQSEQLQMSTAFKKRVGYLQRYKDVASFRLHSLQQEVDKSVIKEEYEALQRNFELISAKYRDVLEREKVLILAKTENENLQQQYSEKSLEADQAKAHLRHAVEKANEAGTALSELQSRLENADKSSSSSIQDQLRVLASKLSTVEMQLLNEKQKCELAMQKYEHAQKSNEMLTSRNKEVEDKFANLTQMNLRAQEVEKELKDKWSGCVTRDENSANLERLKNLEETIVRQQSEASKLKEVAELALAQTSSVKIATLHYENELRTLREALVELQVQSDLSATVGKLQHHLVVLQMSEASAVKRMESMNEKLVSSEGMIMKLEKEIDEREDRLFNHRFQTRSRLRYLQKSLSEVRRQYSGSITLDKQERISHLLRELDARKSSLSKDLEAKTKKLYHLEDLCGVLEAEKQGLEELVETFKSGTGSTKIIEWHKKLMEVRLEDLKNGRQISRLSERVAYYENLVEENEKTIQQLEESIISRESDHEARQIDWERREMELENICADFESEREEIVKAAGNIEREDGRIPDVSKPVAEQLEEALRKLRHRNKSITDFEKTVENKESALALVKEKLGDLELKVIEKEKIINELRSKLGKLSSDNATKDVYSYLNEKKVTENAESDEANLHHNQKVALQTVKSTKALLAKKEEALAKYQDMLTATHKELEAVKEEHQVEITMLNAKLQKVTDENIEKLKKFANASLDPKQSIADALPPETDEIDRLEEERKLEELEEIIHEQEQIIAQLKQHLRDAELGSQELVSKEMEKYRQVLRDRDEMKSSYEAKLERVRSEMEFEVNTLRQTVDVTQQNLHRRESAILDLNNELENVRKSTEQLHVPKNDQAITRLKNQLALKEKQYNQVSKALMNLKAEFLTKAENESSQENLRIQEQTLKQLSDSNAKQLRERVQGLQEQLEVMKEELHNSKQREMALKSSKEALLAELDRQSLYSRQYDSQRRTSDKILSREQRLEAELSELKQRVANNTEVRELQAKIQQLQSRQSSNTSLNRSNTSISHLSRTNNPEVIRWEAEKKWQHKVDSLRAKLIEKQNEIQHHVREVALQKEIIARLEKDKGALKSKLKHGSGSEEVVNTARPSANIQEQAYIESLRRELFECQEEIVKLKRDLQVSAANEITCLKAEIEDQKSQIVSLENHIAALREGKEELYMQKELKSVQDAFSEASNRNLELEKTTLDLQFEKEQAAFELPRIKGRLKDMKQYVDTLLESFGVPAGGSSLASFPPIAQNNKASSQPSIATSSGAFSSMKNKSNAELQKVIEALKRVVEKLQTDNASLRKQSKSNVKYMELLKENKKLKTDLLELKQKPSLSSVPHGGKVAQTKSSSDLSSSAQGDLSKQIIKVAGENEKLRKKIAKSETDISKLTKEKEDVEIKLRHLESDMEKLQSHVDNHVDRKGESSVVAVSHVYDEKIATLEAELNRKNIGLEQKSKECKEASEKSAVLKTEIRKLKEQLSLVRQGTKGGEAIISIATELQQCKDRVVELSTQRNQLTEEIGNLKMALTRATSGSGSDLDFVRQERFDKLLTEFTALQAEKESLVSANAALQKELDPFDSAFFAEVEELKVSHKEALRKLKKYEDQLRLLSHQFGVTVSFT